MKRKETILILQEAKIEDITNNLCKEIELFKKKFHFIIHFFCFYKTEIEKLYDKMIKIVVIFIILMNLY